MDVKNYVNLLAGKIHAAADIGNREAVIQLLRRLRDIADEQADELEKAE